MKKFDIKDVFSWSNAEDAKQYIGKYCYFADKLGDLENQVKKDKHYKLQRVSLLEIVHSVFFADDEFWGLCLPVDKVIEVEEKKWRAFNSDEFLKLFKVGDVLTIKYPKLGEIKTLLTSIRENANQITLGGFNDECFETLLSDGVQILINGN